jgi:hypothetical protein
LSSDSHHIDLLRRGPRTWNAWRAEHPDTVPNLTGISLSAAERQMGQINGGPVNLAGARLRHGSLRFATLNGANLSGADLSDTDLSEARLNGANLSGADLTEALLDQADFAGAYLAGADISGTSLVEVRNLTQAQIDEAVGDALTVLPPHLSRPKAWMGTVSQVAGTTPSRPAREEMPKRSSAPEQVPMRSPEPEEVPLRGPASREPVAPVRGERVSWLVGGPRSGDTRRSTTPLRSPER